MLLSSDLDNHLFEAWHDSCRAEIAEVRHAIACAQREPCVSYQMSVDGLFYAFGPVSSYRYPCLVWVGGSWLASLRCVRWSMLRLAGAAVTAEAWLPASILG